MQATARGYHFAAANPKEAASCIITAAAFTQKPEAELLQNQQSATAAYFLTHEGNWGTMSGERWQEFVEWLEEQKLLVIGEHNPSHLRGTMQEVLFTNRFIEADSTTEV